MMSRKSKKGFTRLNTHEMVELNHSGQKMDSGSENDILDMTTMDDHEPMGGCCSSCCMWFAVLYMGLLTVLVLALGAFCGYILVTTWQINLACNTTANGLHGDINKLKKDLESHAKQTNHVLEGLKHTTFSVNNSFSSMNVSVNSTLDLLVSHTEELDLRLKVLESHPREVLTKQIEDIHHEMSLLDNNMRRLNQSLDELDAMRTDMASMRSQIKSYEAKMTRLSKTIGDTVQNNTVIQDTVQAFSDKIVAFNDHIGTMEAKVNKSHKAVKESANSTLAQFAELQSQISKVNESLREEITELRMDINMTESELRNLSAEIRDLSFTVTDIQIAEVSSTSPTAPTMATPPSATSPTVPPSSTAEEVHESSVNTRSTENVSGTATTVSERDVTDKSSSTVSTENMDSTGTTENFPEDVSNGTQEVGAASTDSVSVSTTEEGKEEERKTGVQVLQKLYDSFAVLDVDGDSEIDYGEFSLFLNSPGVFAMLDRNDDDQLTKEEIQTSIDMLKANSGSDDKETPEEER